MPAQGPCTPRCPGSCPTRVAAGVVMVGDCDKSPVVVLGSLSAPCSVSPYNHTRFTPRVPHSRNSHRLI